MPTRRAVLGVGRVARPVRSAVSTSSEGVLPSDSSDQGRLDTLLAKFPDEDVNDRYVPVDTQAGTFGMRGVARGGGFRGQVVRVQGDDRLLVGFSDGYL